MSRHVLDHRSQSGEASKLVQFARVERNASPHVASVELQRRSSHIEVDDARVKAFLRVERDGTGRV